MNQIENSTNQQLNQQLIELKQKQFTGRLDVKSDSGLQWSLYLGTGRLIWADGGIHPNRSWQRLMDRYCADIEIKTADVNAAKKFECANYYFLTILLQQDNITQEMLSALIKTKINEILFEIVRASSQEKLEYKIFKGSGDYILSSGLKMSLVQIDVEQKIQDIDRAWSKWTQQGLEKISPNLAPKLQQREKLQQKVSKVIYQNFVQLIDGQKTLRDLAVNMNQEVLKLTCSLLPYIRQGFIKLETVPDLPSKTSLEKSYPTTIQKSNLNSDRPLIACIDDSPQICKIMEQIVQQAGYRYISIQQALQAVPTLIAANPDLIFLDIGMPVVNGYEICTQLRRVSKFKEIPIIILTGNDGIVDRVKAKIAGASSFLSKPIEIEKILETIERFLLNNAIDSSLS